jgi:outer membrane protein TolC
MIKHGFVCGLFFNLSVAAHAAPGGSAEVTLGAQIIDLSLAEAVSLGLRDNSAIRSAYLQRVAQKFDLRVAQDRFNPRLSLNAGYLANRGHEERYRNREIAPQATLLSPIGTRFSLVWSSQRYQADRSDNRVNDGLGFSVIQPLLRDAGREVTQAPLRLARLSEQANRLSLKATVARTVTRIASAYRELLRAQEQLRIARDALARSRQLLEVNQALIDTGRMAPFDIVQTEADVTNQELAVEEVLNQQDSSRLALLQLLAIDPSTRLQASDTVQASRIDIDPAQAQALALERQPDYLVQLITGEQAQINLAVANNQRLWDVALVAGANQTRERYQGGGREYQWDSYAGVQVQIPIGDLSARQQQVRAQVEVQDQSIREADSRQRLAGEVFNAVRDLGTRWRQYEIAQRSSELSERKLAIEREKLQVGRSSNFQVLSFEADLRTAQNARLNALIAYLNAQTQLDETLGMTLESWNIELDG